MCKKSSLKFMEYGRNVISGTLKTKHVYLAVPQEDGIESSRTLGTGMYEVMNCDLVGENTQ